MKKAIYAPPFMCDRHGDTVIVRKRYTALTGRDCCLVSFRLPSRRWSKKTTAVLYCHLTPIEE